MAFGDSLTAGFRCGGDDSKFVPYSAELKRRMGASKKLPKSWRAADVVCAGCPGESAAQAVHCGRLQAVLQRLRSPRDAVVVVLSGTNDLRSYPPPPPADVASALRALRDAAVGAGARVLLLTVPPIPSSEVRNASLRARRIDLNRLIVDLAAVEPSAVPGAGAGGDGDGDGGGGGGGGGGGDGDGRAAGAIYSRGGAGGKRTCRVRSADTCRWLDGECAEQWDRDGLHLSKAAYKQLGAFVHDELAAWLRPPAPNLQTAGAEEGANSARVSD